MVNGKFHMLYKDPVTVGDQPKKSHKGIAIPVRATGKQLVCLDEQLPSALDNTALCAFEVLFEHGEMRKRVTLDDVRATVEAT